MIKKISINFNPHDLWVGLRWEIWHALDCERLVIYICLLPALPIRLEICYEQKRSG